VLEIIPDCSGSKGERVFNVVDKVVKFPPELFLPVLYDYDNLITRPTI